MHRSPEMIEGEMRYWPQQRIVWAKADAFVYINLYRKIRRRFSFSEILLDRHQCDSLTWYHSENQNFFYKLLYNFPALVILYFWFKRHSIVTFIMANCWAVGCASRSESRQQLFRFPKGELKQVWCVKVNRLEPANPKASKLLPPTESSRL